MNPVVTVLYHFGSAKLATKSASYLSVIVTFETKNREVRRIIVRRVIVDVMDLYRFARNVAHAANPMVPKHDFGRDIIRDRNSHWSALK